MKLPLHQSGLKVHSTLSTNTVEGFDFQVLALQHGSDSPTDNTEGNFIEICDME